MTSGGSLRPSGTFFQLDGDHVQRYVWAGQLVKGLRVLDAGCGHGYGSEYLADGLAREVVGIDSDGKAIQFARNTYQALNLSFHLMDVRNLRFDDESFDAAISFEVIEHLRDVNTYLREIKRVLKSGGVLLLSTPNRRFHERFSKDGKPLSRFHVHEFYPEELLQELERYFLTSGIFYLSGKNDEALYSYFHSCAVPRWARNHVPLFLKDAWLRFRGVPSITRDVRGRWTDFDIKEVSGIEELGPDRAVQLFKCTKE